MLVIREATVEDISAIQKLAEEIWMKTYSSIISTEQINYMLDLFYSEKSLLKQMNEDEHFFLLVVEDEVEIGFASFSRIENDIFKLHKIYVHPNQQGKGTGKKLIEFIEDEIRNQKGIAIDLNVNRFNPAKSFYEKIGFKIIRDEDIDIGNNFFMNDYVMRKNL